MDMRLANTFPLEGRLLAALVRFPEESAVRQAKSLLQQEIDWGRLIHMAVEQDILPFAYHNLNSALADAVPAGVLRRLRALYLHQFRRSIQVRGEVPRLLRQLRDVGIDALVFKGPALAALAYRQENLRTYTDLDLLIRRDDVPKTAEALSQLGFREKNPIPPSYDATWDSYFPWQHPHANANGYVRDANTHGALHVDIHWGLASRYFQFPMEPGALWSRQVTVPLDNGEEIPTFSPEDTLLFQCMHAAKDGYYRLGHICDIAELLRTHRDLDAGRVLRRSKALRCQTMVHLGLALSTQLLGAPRPSGADSPADARDLSQLTRHVAAGLFRRRHGISRLFHLCWFHLRVRDRLRDGLGAVYHAIRTSLRPTKEDRAWISLPETLDPLYYFVRPVRRLTEFASGEKQPDASWRSNRSPDDSVQSAPAEERPEIRSS